MIDLLCFKQRRERSTQSAGISGSDITGVNKIKINPIPTGCCCWIQIVTTAFTGGFHSCIGGMITPIVNVIGMTELGGETETAGITKLAPANKQQQRHSRSISSK